MTVQLIDLFWQDILFPKVLRLLTYSDLLRLRCISNAYKEMIDKYFAELRAFDSELCSSKKMTLVILKRCSRLKFLNLVSISGSSLDIEQMFENNFNLEVLFIKNCRDWDEHCFMTIIRNCKSLKILHIQDCNWLSTGLLATMLQHKPNLELRYLGNVQSVKYRILGELMLTYKMQPISIPVPLTTCGYNRVFPMMTAVEVIALQAKNTSQPTKNQLYLQYLNS